MHMYIRTFHKFFYNTLMEWALKAILLVEHLNKNVINKNWSRK